MILPKYGSRAKAHFLPASNGVASDEIQGHVGMFAGNTNDGYYKLGLDTAGLIRDAVLSSRGIVENVPSPPTGPQDTAPFPLPTKNEQNDLIQF